MAAWVVIRRVLSPSWRVLGPMARTRRQAGTPLLDQGTGRGCRGVGTGVSLPILRCAIPSPLPCHIGPSRARQRPDHPEAAHHSLLNGSLGHGGTESNQLSASRIGACLPPYDRPDQCIEGQQPTASSFCTRGGSPKGWQSLAPGVCLVGSRCDSINLILVLITRLPPSPGSPRSTLTP